VIDVIDYRAGNSPSVVYALEKIGLPCRLVGKPEEVLASERLILPGVGAARATLASLDESGLTEPLVERVRRDRIPFLGICIGLQVLFDHSEEDDTPGLGLLGGIVRRFPDTGRVPQIGWNEVAVTRTHPLWEGLPDRSHFYFVNSYYAVPSDPDCVVATTDYGVEFCSVVGRENIAATQFHAEKSGALGLRVLANFAEWTP
jgi:glutamine amidotransferase